MLSISLTGFGNTNVDLVYKVKSRDVEYYGNIFLQLIREESEDFIIEILNHKLDVVRRESEPNESDIYVFDYLPPGTYYIRYIKDENNNGKWDTGNYLQKRHPESVLYFPDELKLRSNWDLNEIFVIKKDEQNKN